MKEKIHLRTIIIFAILGLILSISVTTLAKYVIEEFHGYFLNAKYFSFTSNRLTKNEPVYLVNNWSGVGSFSISFDLLSEKNRYFYSEFDIPYTVNYTCPSDVICEIDKPTGTIYASSDNHSDTVTLNVTPTRAYNENDKLSIYIEASSVEPYKETLNARFEYVVGKQGVTYEIDDEANRVYLLLKITNAITYCSVKTPFSEYQVGDLIDIRTFRELSSDDQSKCVSQYVDLSFNPNELLLDTTDNILDISTYQNQTIDNTSYINQLSFSINPVSTTAIKFYKKDTTKDYSYPIVNDNSIIGVNIHD